MTHLLIECVPLRNIVYILYKVILSSQDINLRKKGLNNAKTGFKKRLEKNNKIRNKAKNKKQ